MHEIIIPNPSEQYKKTPAWKIVERQVEVLNMDGTKKLETIRERTYVTVGSGMEMKILTWADWLENVKVNVKDLATLEKETVPFTIKQGRWGLGCPNNCGRHWEFKPTEDLTGFEPVDPAAKTPFTDIDGKTHNGYLEWTPQTDGSIVFKCDKCGAEIKLRKM